MWRSKVFRNSLNKINAKNPCLAHKLDAQSGILTKEDIPKLIEVDPMFIVVMKLREAQMLCPAKYVNHFTDIIDEHRDMSNHKYGPKNFMNCSDVVTHMTLQAW
jgi:hypothetical protein